MVTQLLQSDPMFDLGAAAQADLHRRSDRGVRRLASIFSLLTYLVIYVQNVLGYSAVATGVRFLFLSGAAFVAAADRGPAHRSRCRRSG